MKLAFFSGINGDMGRLRSILYRMERIVPDYTFCLGNAHGHTYDPEIAKYLKSCGVYSVRGRNELSIDGSSPLTTRIPDKHCFTQRGLEVVGCNAIDIPLPDDFNLNLSVREGSENKIGDQVIKRSRRRPHDVPVLGLGDEKCVSLKYGQQALVTESGLRLMSNVVVVEDGNRFARSYARSFESRGITPKIVGTYEHGLDVALTEYPDIMVVDGNLDDQHGIDLIRQLHDTVDFGIYIIAVSGDQTKSEDDWLDAGSNEYHFKGRKFNRRTPDRVAEYVAKRVKRIFDDI